MSKKKVWSRAEVIQLVYRSPRESEASLAERIGRTPKEVQEKYAEWRKKEVTGLSFIEAHPAATSESKSSPKGTESTITQSKTES